MVVMGICVPGSMAAGISMIREWIPGSEVLTIVTLYLLSEIGKKERDFCA